MTNILCIDRDEATQNTIQTALGDQYHLITANSGSMALHYCDMIQPDLVLMATDLPDIKGDELALRLKMFMPNVPILFMTTGHHPPLPDPLLEANRLVKPLQADILQQKIQSLFTISTPDDERQTTAQSSVESQVAALSEANQRLASLNAVSAIIGTSLDLEHLMDEVLSQINRIIAFDSATLFLLKGNILEAAASRGFSEYRRGMNSYQRSEHNSAWLVVFNKLPLIINDVTQSDHWEPRPELDRIKAWLGVPLIYKNRVVGVLTLDKHQTEAFTEADARYLFTLTNQIAVAVENAQLFQEWEAQSTRLKLINEVSQEISTLLDVDDLFDTLARSIFERLAYDYVAIFEVDGTGAVLTLKALYGEQTPGLKINRYQQPLDVEVEGRAIEAGRAVVVNDISQVEPTFFDETLAIRSKLVTPIFVNRQAEAIIYVGCCSVDGFSDQDLWTLSSLTSQAAKIVESAQLYQEVQIYSSRLERTVIARTRRLQAIKKISQMVSRGLAVDDLLAVVGQGIHQIFDPAADRHLHVVVGLVEGSFIVLNVIAKTPVRQSEDVADPETAQIERVFPVKLDAYEPIAQVIRQAKPLILDKSAFQIARNEQSAHAKALMMVPLITAGQTIGLIGVESEAIVLFDDSDLETLELLAFHVASAIEYARLLQKTRELAIVEERTRLASDMHDGVAQNLAYLMLQVDRCLNLVETDSELEHSLEHVRTLLSQNIEEVRRNILDLRPVDLEGHSFFEAVKKFVLQFSQRWGMAVDCHIAQQPVTIFPEVERSLYRILQEALSNARQHAECNRLTVELTIADQQWLTLKVEDDGRGFDVEQRFTCDRGAYQGRGLGLVSMRERAERFGGDVRVNSVKGQGTAIVVKLPLQAEM